MQRADPKLNATALSASLVLAVAVLLPLSVRADDTTTHFDNALALYKDKKLDAALGEFTQARQAYRDAHKNGPEDARILHWIGFIDLQERHYADAVEPLQQAIKVNPRSSEAHLNLGNAYDGLKQYTDAEREFKKAIELQPATGSTRLADPYYNLGSVYYKLKRVGDAVSAYKHAADLNPKDPYIQDGLGFAFQADGDYKAAVAAGERATRLEPNNVTFLMNLALAYLGQVRMAKSKAAAETARTEALALFARAADRSPSSYAVHEAYGETLYDVGKDADAVGQFQKAMQLDSKQFNPYYNMGLAQARMGHTSDAVESYTHALTVKPDSREALHGLGLAQYKSGRYDDAVKTYTTLTQTSADDTVAWINLASSLRASGDTDGEIAALEQALRHGADTPRMAVVRRAVAGYYYRKGDAASLARASDEYTRSLRQTPGNAAALNGLGLVAAKQKHPEDAIRYFRSAIASRPEFDDAYNNLGVAYETIRNVAEAKASYRKALQINPKNALARRNLDRFDKPVADAHKPGE